MTYQAIVIKKTKAQWVSTVFSCNYSLSNLTFFLEKERFIYEEINFLKFAYDRTGNNEHTHKISAKSNYVLM